MTECPYCKSKLKEVSRDENLGSKIQPSIEVVFQCPSCKKEPMMILEFEGWYDEDDNPLLEPAMTPQHPHTAEQVKEMQG